MDARKDKKRKRKVATQNEQYEGVCARVAEVICIFLNKKKIHIY